MCAITAFIFARGGSKGLPGKNIKPLTGKPLIGWAIEQALAVPRIDRVIVSTDSPAIAAVARDHGAETPFLRPDTLASDNASEWDAWRHALTFLQETEGAIPDVFVSVPATAPLRLSKDIEACIDRYLEGGVDAVITVTEAHRNPWFNMVRSTEDGSFQLASNPTGTVFRRQDAPEVYDITTIAYALDPQFILAQTRLFAGRVGAVVAPVERAIDIDTAYDFEIAEFLMTKRVAVQ